MKYLKVRSFFLRRNKRIFKDNYGWDFKLFPDPYRKIKTVFYLEFSAIFLYLLNKTNIKPDYVTVFGVFWVYLGTILISTAKEELIYFGLFIYFTKLVPDYIDGALAYLKGKQSKEGHELDVWAGEINKIGVITGVLMYIFNSTKNLEVILLLLIIVLLNFLDPRRHLRKFSKTIYDKKSKSHLSYSKKTKNNFIFIFFKFLNYDGRTSYSDFLILLILIDMNTQLNNVLIIFPWLWAAMSSLALCRSIFLVLNR